MAAARFLLRSGAMNPLNRLSLVLLPLLLPLLIGPVEGGCSPCNCPDSVSFFQFPAELDVQLAATGEACSSAPFCEEHGDGGACTEYTLRFTGTGACHLTATASDGRQVSADVSAGVLYADTCCGTAYGPDYYARPSLTFDQDASTSGG
jgi:hypothetical protein